MNFWDMNGEGKQRQGSSPLAAACKSLKHDRYLYLAIKDYSSPPPPSREEVGGLLIQDDVHNGEGIRDGNLAVTIHISCIEDKDI